MENGAPKKNRTGLIIAIVVAAVLLCCCVATGLAVLVINQLEAGREEFEMSQY